MQRGDVAEVAGGALGAPVQPPAADDSGADAGRDLDEDEVLHVGVDGGVLAQGHQVDVVVDEHRPAEGGPDVPGHVVVVPTGHDRRQHRSPGRVLDGAGQTDADAGEVVAGAPGRRQQRPAGAGNTVEHRFGAGGDVQAQRLLRQHAAAQVGEGDQGVGGAEVGPDDHTGIRVEGEPGRGPAAGGGGLPRGSEQAGRHEGVDPGTHGRPGQAGHPDQLGAGTGAPVEHQLEQLTGSRRAARSCERANRAGHGGSEAHDASLRQQDTRS